MLVLKLWLFRLFNWNAIMTTETENNPSVTKGLKGILAADSTICLVNGAEGRLLYRGYNIDELATESSFEQVTFLLLKGELPTEAELKPFANQLRENLKLPKQVADFLYGLPKGVNPMSALRSAISIAGIYDEEANTDDLATNFKIAIRLTSLISTVTAAFKRIQEGKEPVEPKDDLCFAGNFMYMMTGKEPTQDETRAMDLLLILHAEHGFNASTFTARVIVATLTDFYSSITGAIGALKGKLHGGANTEVLKTLLTLKSKENVAAWITEVRDSKGKFMGFGHAVYQTADPRAKFLKEYSRRLGEGCNDTTLYELSIEIEKQVTAEISRDCNVDFFSASVQHYMGIPGDMFTCIFAASRITGWCAHVLEQLTDNKIIRPKANYIGPEERAYPAIEDR